MFHRDDCSVRVGLELCGAEIIKASNPRNHDRRPTKHARCASLSRDFDVKSADLRHIKTIWRSRLPSTRIANAIFHLSAFDRFPALHCLSMIQGTVYLVMDSMIELNDYYQLYH